MASGARRGDIHSLDFTRIAWNKDGTEVTLRPHADYIAKNYDPRLPASNFQGFTIKAFSATLDRSDPERTLCPVRALKFYLRRTEGNRAGRNQLFLPIKENKKTNVSKNTISRWIVEAIKRAYITVDRLEDLRQLHQIRAHEVRAISNSVDAWRNVSLGAILESCGWRSSTSFIDFYLRDMVEYEQELTRFKKLPTPSSSRQ